MITPGEYSGDFTPAAREKDTKQRTQKAKWLNLQIMILL
jgi:hypothetical protein